MMPQGKCLKQWVLVGLSCAALHAQAGGNNFATLSDVLAVGLPLTALGVSVAQDDAAGTWQLVKSEAATLASVEVLKRSIHAERPNHKDKQSFPSGHTAVAFAAAQYMQMRGGWEYGVPAYVLAGVVGYSRVRADEHYWRDVAAGAVIGAVASYAFTDPQEKRRFSVSAAPGGIYAQMQARW